MELLNCRMQAHETQMFKCARNDLSVVAKKARCCGVGGGVGVGGGFKSTLGGSSSIWAESTNPSFGCWVSPKLNREGIRLFKHQMLFAT